MSGDPRLTGRRAMRLLCVCHGAQCTRRLLRALAEMRSSRGGGHGVVGGHGGNGTASTAGDESIQRRDERIRTELNEAFKQALCFLQAAHIGKVPGLRTGDVAVCLMGIYTTAVDLRDMWHRFRGREEG